MAIPPLLLQTAGSLVAILALAGLAWWLRLGGMPLLRSADNVRQAAAEIEDCFLPISIALDHQGASALAADAQGRIMLIKRHGNRFAGRVLTGAAKAHLWQDLGQSALEVDCGEARFGRVFLDLAEPETWAEAINRLQHGHDA
jgi:hypothetical protein